MWARICLTIGIISLLIDVVSLFLGFYVGFGAIILFSLLLFMFVSLKTTAERGMKFREEIPEGSRISVSD